MRDRLLRFTIAQVALTLTLVVAFAAPLRGQPAQDGVAILLSRLEQLLQKNDGDSFPSLLSSNDITGAEAVQATDALFSYETSRAVVRERGRQALQSALPGDGYRIV